MKYRCSKSIVQFYDTCINNYVSFLTLLNQSVNDFNCRDPGQWMAVLAGELPAVPEESGCSICHTETPHIQEVDLPDPSHDRTV